MDIFKPQYRYDLGRFYKSYKTGSGGYYNKYVEIQVKGNKARFRLHDRVPSQIVSPYMDIQMDNLRGRYLNFGEKRLYFSDCIVL